MSSKPKTSSQMIVLFLSGCIFVLAGVHVWLQGIKYIAGDGNIARLIPIFDLNAERNVPTIFSFLLLFFASALLAKIAFDAKQLSNPYVWHWAWLSGIFCWLSLDEIFEIHERWIRPMRNYFHTDGFLFFIWQLPYMLVGLVILYFYVPFFKNIGPVRRYMFISAGVFLCGVVVLETFEGWFFANMLNNSMPCIMLETAEEVLEMSGAVIFIYALLEHIRTSKN